jgi:hypothetical protein
MPVALKDDGSGVGYAGEVRTMRSDICGRTEDDWPAIEAGWWPYFWITQGIRREEPVCPEYAQDHLEGSEEEPILKDRHLIALGGDG